MSWDNTDTLYMVVIFIVLLGFSAMVFSIVDKIGSLTDKEIPSGEEFVLQFVSGTEYTWLEPGQIITEVRNRTSDPVGDACNVSIWYPNKTVFVDSEFMMEELSQEDTFGFLVSNVNGFFTIPSKFPGQSFVVPANISYISTIRARLGIATGGGPETITAYITTIPCNSESCLIGNNIANDTQSSVRFTTTTTTFSFNVSVTSGQTYYFYGQHAGNNGTTYGYYDNGANNYSNGTYYNGNTSLPSSDQHMSVYASYFGSGNWHYNFTVPPENGVYEYQSTCSVGSATAKASKSFHVVPKRIRAEVTK